MVVVFAGLPGSGKTYFAKKIAARFDHFTILNKDVVRSVLFPGALTDYSSEQDDFCVDVMLQASRMILARNPKHHIIIDGRTFMRSYQVEQVVNTMQTHSIPYRFVKFHCSDETAQKRLEAGKEKHLAKNRDYQLYLQIKESADPLKVEHLTLSSDGDQDIEERIKVFISYVER